MKKIVRTHWEVRWQERDRELPLQALTFDTEPEARLKAMSIALDDPSFRTSLRVEVYEVETHEEEIGYYTKKDVEKSLKPERPDLPIMAPETFGAPSSKLDDEIPF